MTRNLVTLNIGEHSSDHPPQEGKPAIILNGRAIEHTTLLAVEAHAQGMTEVTFKIIAAVGEQEIKPDYYNDYYTDIKEFGDRIEQLTQKIKHFDELLDTLKKAKVNNAFVSQVQDYRRACLTAKQLAKAMTYHMALGVIVPKSLFTDAMIYKDCNNHADTPQEQ